MSFQAFKLLGGLLIIAGFSLSSPAVRAQEDILKLKLPNPLKESPETSKSKTKASIGVQSSQYISGIPGKPELNRSLLLSVTLQPELKTERTTSALDFTAERYADWGISNYSVREVYWSRHWRDEKSQFAIGRKLEFWSQLDHDWNLGIWQPKTALEPVRPDEQGLTGMSFRHQEGEFESLAIVAPIFIPTMGPEIREEDGNIVSDSRWYRSPSSTFILFNQQRQVEYSLNIPELQELVFKPGAGIRLSYGRNSQGFWGSLNAGYKPMNNLVVRYDKKLELSEEGQDSGSAPLFPSAAYHSLWGGDFGYRIGGIMVAASYLEDRPLNNAPVEPYIIQYAQPMKAYSVHAESLWEPRFLAGPLSTSLGYLRIDGGGFEDFDSQGVSQGAVFSDRFYFYNAGLFQIRYSGNFFRRKLVSSFKYLREFEQKGVLTGASIEYFPLAGLGVAVGADVLGVDDPENTQVKSGFLNEFRANDRIYTRMNYVF